MATASVKGLFLRGSNALSHHVVVHKLKIHRTTRMSCRFFHLSVQRTMEKKTLDVPSSASKSGGTIDNVNPNSTGVDSFSSSKTSISESTISKPPSKDSSTSGEASGKQSPSASNHDHSTPGQSPQSPQPGRHHQQQHQDQQRQQHHQPRISVESIGSATLQYTHELNKAYADIERNLMKRVHTSNLRNFRIALLGTIVGITWIGAVFGGQVSAAKPSIVIPYLISYNLSMNCLTNVPFNERIVFHDRIVVN